MALPWISHSVTTLWLRRVVATHEWARAAKTPSLAVTNLLLKEAFCADLPELSHTISFGDVHHHLS